MTDDAIRSGERGWVRDDAEFKRYFLGAGPSESGVLLNSSDLLDDDERALPLGQALNLSLHGPTTSFTAIVGYFFHHGASLMDDAGLEDPAQIILREAEEGRLSDYWAGDDAGSGFRLLAGELNSRPAQLAARVWYLLCRSRHQDEDHRAEADAMRARFLGASKQRGFICAARDLLDPRSDFDGPLQSAQSSNGLAGFVSGLSRAPGEKPAGLQKFTAAVQEDLEHQQTRDAAGILLGFLLQRAGDFRMDARGQSGGAKFHPKLYVVERGAPTDATSHRTIAFVGSNNWSAHAFGMATGNVEVATVHSTTGHLWHAPGSGQTPDADRLCVDVTHTARAIFEHAPSMVGSWLEPAAQPLTAAKVLRITTLRMITKPPVQTQTSEALRELAPHLHGLVRRLLGVPNLKRFDRDISAILGHEGSLFGGQTPAMYQVDGVLRLLGVLEGGDSGEGSRGAFLTDEPGLGKTLISQICAAILLAHRLAVRPPGDASAKLRASFIVPARLRGRRAEGGASATGWRQRAEEVSQAVRYLLEHAHALSPAEADARVRQCELRVFSHGGFTPEALTPAPDVEDLWAPLAGPAPRHVRDFEFIAGSEVVVIDESHNFRNQSARATRTLRFLLSLPVPGESWPLVGFSVGETIMSKPVSSEDDPQGASTPRRQVLNLSATPFNNRLEDLITQIGHFAQYQGWSKPYATKHTRLSQTELPGVGATTESIEQLVHGSLEAWHTLDTPNDDRLEAFRRLLCLVRRHLHSGRALCVPPDQARAKAGAEKDSRSRYDDLGPEYEWSEQAKGCEDAFASALDWRRSQVATESSDETDPPSEDTPTSSKELEARRLLETQLTRLFVQRSRIRALRIIEAGSDDPDQSRGMFREPRVPRHPLALNPAENAEGEGASASQFERDVLRELFSSLLDTSGTQGATSSESDHLTFFAYELSVRRSRTDQQTLVNTMGFQKIGLIKRLQSSPYAFLRTLVRGVLRQSLSELALLERALYDAKLRPLLSAAAESAHTDLATLEDALADLTTATVATVDQVVALGDGSKPSASDEDAHRAFQVRCGWLGADGASPPTRQRPATYAGYYATLTEGLSAEPSPANEWIRMLLSDVACGKQSKLFHDIERVASWIKDKLLPALYGDLGRLRLLGKPFHKITARTLDFDALDSSKKRALGSWVLARLRSDHRALSLLGWLLLQAAVHGELGRAESASLPGRYRSLVFSQYTDTQDYLIAVFAAAHQSLLRLGQDGPQLVTELRDLLRSAVGEVGAALIQGAAHVQQAAPHPNAYADPSRYRSPVPVAWLERWLKRSQASPALIDEAMQSLGRHLGCASGKGDTRPLAAASTLVTSPTAEHVVLDGTALAPQQLGSVVSAFSPWYQIAPEPVTSPPAARDYLRQLGEAASSPVHVLLATDILAEGVNLQECGVVIHYDLPWNPTVLIQRNGRVDRRLNPAYESEQGRSAISEQLFRATGRIAGIPSFSPPEQIYHFTVVPAEPRVGPGEDSVQDQVRSRLGAKLEDIRALFGLTNWPVVLNNDGASEVLSGELDFETPGFRRREELFAALRKLEDVEASQRPSRLAQAAQPLGSLILRVRGDLRRRLAQRLGASDVAAGGSISVAELMSLGAAGIVSWTYPKPSSRLVRSTADAADMGGAISGTLVAPEAEDSLDVLTWFKRSLRDHTQKLAPLWVSVPRQNQATNAESMPASLPARDLALAASGRESAWGAPTELADEIVLCLLDAAFEGAGLSVVSSSDPVPLSVLGLSPQDADATPIRWLRQGALLDSVQDQPNSAFTQFREDEGRAYIRLTHLTPVALPDPLPEPSTPNLWLVF